MGIISYDFFDLPEIPTFILCNPNKEELFALGGISERKYIARFNALSEISFKAHEYVDDTLMPYYSHISHKRLVYLENIGYFMITAVSEKGDGITKHKEVKADSLEVEFNGKNLSKFERTSVTLYNTVTPGGTVLGDIISYMPGWSIDEVDGELITKYRSFDISSDKSIYNFLMNDVEETYECIFKFDSVNKTIKAETLGSATKTTDIYISYDNLLETINIEETADELVTALTVLGGNDLDIRSVNPLGTNTLYDFTYFKDIEWMSQDLIDAITAWETLCSGSKVEYSTLYSDVRNKYLDEYVPLDTAISGSEINLAAAETQKAALIRAGYGQDPASPEPEWTTVTNEINTISGSITIASASLVVIDGEIDAIWAEMAVISTGLSLTNEDNFTLTQQIKLQPFIIESSYVNENIIQTDIMNTAEIQDQAEELYNQGLGVLDRVSEPRYTFGVTSANFMMIKDFEPFMEEVELGAILNLEVKPGVIVYPILLEMSLDFDNPSSFSMKFGNRLRLDDEAFQFSDLMNEAISSANSAKVNSLMWKNWHDNYKDSVSLFISSALDASLNNVISGSAQEVKITPSGLRGRAYVSDGIYADEQVWLVNNMLAFTDDNWDSAKIAIGEFTTTSGTAWGIVADYLVGRVIAGNDLIISNYNDDTGETTFTVSGSKVTLTDMDLTLTNPSGSTVIYMNAEEGIKITDKTNAEVLYIDTNGNLVFAGDLSGASGTFSGEISATSGDIGGWRITSGSLVSPTNNSGMSSGATWAFYAGHATPASAPFRVGHNGNLYASNAYLEGEVKATSGSFTGTITALKGAFTGTITAAAGTIGGWTINSSGLISGGTTFYPSSFSLASGSVVWNGSILTIHGTIRAYSGTIGGWTIDSNAIRSLSNQSMLYASGSLIFAGGEVFVNSDGLNIKETSSRPSWPNPSGVNWKYDQYRYGGMYGHLDSGDQCLYMYNYSSSLSYDSAINIFSSNYNGDQASLYIDAATLYPAGGATDELHGGNFLFKVSRGGNPTGSIRFRSKGGPTNAIESGNYSDNAVQNLSITGFNGGKMTTFGIGATTTYIDGIASVVTSGTDANRYSVAWNSSTKELIFYSSDEKLKENISYDIKGLDIIEKLKPAKFNFIDSKEKRVGFIAQDTLNVSPLLAWNNQEEDTWGLGGWDAFSAIIVKAIQEQQNTIKALEKKINLLENKEK